MSKINLLKEQKELLEKRKKYLLDKQKGIYASIMSEGLVDIKNDELTDTVSSGVYEERIIIEEELREIEDILENSVVVSNKDKTKIGIGSNFSARVDFGDEIENLEFTLVENREGLGANYVSISSEFGKSVLGKTLNESFEYNMINGKIAKGIITSIEGKSINNKNTSKEDRVRQAMKRKYEYLIEKREQLMQGGYSKTTIKHMGLLNLKIAECEFWLSNNETEKTKKIVK